jgi:hypothetical protein
VAAGSLERKGSTVPGRLEMEMEKEKGFSGYGDRENA